MRHKSQMETKNRPSALSKEKYIHEEDLFRSTHYSFIARSCRQCFSSVCRPSEEGCGCRENHSQEGNCRKDGIRCKEEGACYQASQQDSHEVQALIFNRTKIGATYWRLFLFAVKTISR